MNSSAGLFVIAVGAIVALGIRDSSGRINFAVIGIIIMLAGVAGSWVSYTIAAKRRRAAVIVDTAPEESRGVDSEH